MHSARGPVAAILLPLLAICGDLSHSNVVIESDAIADVMDYLLWRDAVFVYDEVLPPAERQSLLAMLADHHVATITLRVHASRGDVITSVVSAIQSTIVRNILLCVQPNTTIAFLQQAQAADMLQQQYQWLVACFGHHVRDVRPFLSSSPSNLALLTSGVTSSSSVTHNIAAVEDNGTRSNISQSDSVWSPPVVSPSRCRDVHVFSFNLHTTTFDHVASWTPGSRLTVFHDVIFPGLFHHFNNVTLRIAAWEAKPFTIRTYKNGKLKYEGFCFDILDEMARYLNFSYEVVEPPDGKYGAPEANGTWNGMVGMLMRGELDMAVGPFSITPERKTVVDFTVPYMEDGGGILTKGGEPGPDLLNLFRPFGLMVWLMLGAAIVVTAVILFFIIKVTSLLFPQHVSAGTPQLQRWTLEDCFLAIYGSLMCQGAPHHPNTSSGRLVLGCWWLFTILVVSIYTASLAALLTVRVQGDRVDSIHDLAASSLHPVTLLASNWWTLFMDAEQGVYRTVGDRMARSPVIRLNEEGLVLVHDGTAALILDVNQASYLFGLDCKELHMAKTVFNSNGLGFPLPKNAYYREVINSIILKLQEGGFLEAWKQRWWTTSADCTSSSLTVSGARQLQVVSIGGILIMYAVVIALAILLHLLHWLLQLPCCYGLKKRWELRFGRGVGDHQQQH